MLLHARRSLHRVPHVAAAATALLSASASATVTAGLTALAACVAMPAAVAAVPMRCFTSERSRPADGARNSESRRGGGGGSRGRGGLRGVGGGGGRGGLSGRRTPRSRADFIAAHAPAPLDASRPEPRNPLRRLTTPEPDDITELFGNISINWYPGHMAAAKSALSERLSKCHLVLEVRDARIPFSSGNPEFEPLLGGKKKILVFNKSDLADPRSFGDIRRHFESRGQPCMLMSGDPFRPRVNKRSISGASSAQAYVKATGVNRAQMRALHGLISTTLGPRRFNSVPPVILVVGLPNTGKSTLINQFRLYGKLAAGTNAAKSFLDSEREETNKMQKGGVAKTGAMPGLTRSISGFLVSSSAGTAPSSSSAAQSTTTDKLFLLDTPGIMLPYIASDRRGVELGLKLGAVAAVKDCLVGEEILARFVLWTLNRQAEFAYVNLLDLPGPTTDLGEVLVAIWRKHYANTVSNSDLFHKFSREAKQRRRWQERDQAEEAELEGEGTDELQRMKAQRTTQQQEEEQESGPILPPVTAPLRSFGAPIASPAAASAATAASLPAASPSSSPSSSLPSASFSPSSLADLSNEESMLCTAWFLKRFRRGELGKITLDEVPSTSSRSSSKQTPRRQHRERTREAAPPAQQGEAVPDRDALKT